MTRCIDCRAARETDGLHTRYDSLKCLFCAARLIQRIGRLGIAASEAAKRRTQVLKDAVANGQDEAQIRALVKGPMALQPMPAKGRA